MVGKGSGRIKNLYNRRNVRKARLYTGIVERVGGGLEYWNYSCWKVVGVVAWILLRAWKPGRPPQTTPFFSFTFYFFNDGVWLRTRSCLFLFFLFAMKALDWVIGMEGGGVGIRISMNRALGVFTIFIAGRFTFAWRGVFTFLLHCYIHVHFPLYYIEMFFSLVREYVKA